MSEGKLLLINATGTVVLASRDQVDHENDEIILVNGELWYWDAGAITKIS